MGIAAIICMSLVCIIAMIFVLAFAADRVDDARRSKDDVIRVKLDLDEPVKMVSTIDEREMRKVMDMLPDIYKDMMKSLTDIMNDMD